MRKGDVLPAVRCLRRARGDDQPGRAVGADDRTARPHAVGADALRRDDSLLHVLPMHKVFTHPVRPADLRPVRAAGIALIKEVIVPVVIEPRVRLVHPHPGRDRMVLRAVPVAFIHGGVEHDVLIIADGVPACVLVRIQCGDLRVRQFRIVNVHLVQKSRNEVAVDPVDGGGRDIFPHAQRVGGCHHFAARVFGIDLFVDKLSVQIQADPAARRVIRRRDVAPLVQRKVVYGVVERRRKHVPRFGILEGDFQPPRPEIAVAEQPALVEPYVALADDAGQPFGVEVVFKDARRDPRAHRQAARADIFKRIVLDIVGNAVHIQAVPLYPLAPQRVACGFHQVRLIFLRKHVLNGQRPAADRLCRLRALPFVKGVIGDGIARSLRGGILRAARRAEQPEGARRGKQARRRFFEKSHFPSFRSSDRPRRCLRRYTSAQRRRRGRSGYSSPRGTP